MENPSRSVPEVLRELADRLEKFYEDSGQLVIEAESFLQQELTEETLLHKVTDLLNETQKVIHQRKLVLQQNEMQRDFEKNLSHETKPSKRSGKETERIIPSFMEAVGRWDDPRFDDLRLYLDKERKARGTFIVESRWPIERLFNSHKFPVKCVILTPNNIRWMQTFLEEKLGLDLSQIGSHSSRELTSSTVDHSATKFYVIDDITFKRMIGFELHRGVVAIALRPPLLSPEDFLSSLKEEKAIFVCLEKVANPENVGTICRSSLALGASAVLLAPSTSDPLYRKSLRSSMGATTKIPTIVMTPWPESLELLKQSHTVIVALTLTPTSVPMGKIIHLLNFPESPPPPGVPPEVASRLRTYQRIALLLGHEGEGVTAEAVERADVCVRVEMFPDNADSLNVGNCSSIALYSFAVALGLLQEGEKNER